MQVRYLNNQDEQAWDHFVQGSVYGGFMQS